MGFSRRGFGAVAAHTCSACVGQAVPGMLWDWCRIGSKAAPGSSRTCLCPTAPLWDFSCAPAPSWARSLLCAALAVPHPDLLGLMAPRFISPFPETWKLLFLALWQLLQSASRGAATPPAPFLIPAGKQRPSASPALQTKKQLKNLSEKSVLSWKLEDFVGSSLQIASTASGPTAPQEGAQAGIPLPIQLCLEPISQRRDTDLLYNLTPEPL